jgi:O-Antigen ligase
VAAAGDDDAFTPEGSPQLRPESQPQPLPLHALLLLAALAAGGVAQGAFHLPGQVLVGVGLAGSLAAALVRQPLTKDDLGYGWLAALGALAAWALIRGAIEGDLTIGVPTAALVAGVAAVVLVARRIPPAQRPALAGGLVAIGVVVALSAWFGVASHFTLWASPGQGMWRGAATLTYANAAAGLLAPLALVALARCALRPVPALAPAAAALLLAGLGATLSRGGVLVLLLGLAVLAWRLGPGRMLRALAAPALGAGIALAGLVPGLPELAPARLDPAVAGLLAGLAVATVPVLADRFGGRMAARLPILGRRAATVGLAAGALGGGLLVAVGLAVADPATPDAAGTASAMPRTAQALATARLTVLPEDRIDGMRAAMRLVRSEPLIGMGSGQAQLFYQDADGRLLLAHYVHNEYVQVLAELGAIGLALLLVVLACLAVAVARGRGSAGSAELGAAVSAALLALAVHSGLDFLWHVPVIPLTGAALVGLSTRPPALEKRGTGSAA